MQRLRVQQQSPVRPPEEEGVRGYRGLELEQAELKAKAEGHEYRVVSRDGVLQDITRDFNPDRLNFVVVAGKVSQAPYFG